MAVNLLTTLLFLPSAGKLGKLQEKVTISNGVKVSFERGKFDQFDESRH